MDNQYIDASSDMVSEASNKLKSYAHTRNWYHYMGLWSINQAPIDMDNWYIKALLETVFEASNKPKIHAQKYDKMSILILLII